MTSSMSRPFKHIPESFCRGTVVKSFRYHLSPKQLVSVLERDFLNDITPASRAMNTETANLLFQLLYVLRQDHVVAAKITAVRCGGTLLLIPYPSMIGSADAGVTCMYVGR